MRQYVPACIFLIFLLCLSFNYTIPIHGDAAQHTNLQPSQSKQDTHPNSNRYERCSSVPSGATGWTAPSPDLQTVGTSLHPGQLKPGPTGNNNLSADDLRHYEQMVIMKKYPYLDLKDLELKFHSPSGKNVRQNSRFAVDRGLGNEPAICEPLEDGPNVEVFNRGLSGFSMPQMKVTDARQAADKGAKKSHILDSLKEDIKEFVEKKNSKLDSP